MRLYDLNSIKAAFLGHAIGDALGVPVEFKTREFLSFNPVSDYLGFMCWNQPPGTFSDDTSMMLCTAESICSGFDINAIASNFLKWYKEGYWGAHYKLFDIGGTTKRSLDRIFNGETPKYSGDFFPENNGNGSLMRILPMIFYLANEQDVTKRFDAIKQVSSITHAHFRSVFACFIFVEFGINVLKYEKFEAYKKMINQINSFVESNEFNPNEIELFRRILNGRIYEFAIDQISSTGYVLDTLESVLWCFLNSFSFKESVLKAVNLGGDTDTTAAINGGIAGIYYSLYEIPKEWVNQLARKDDIILLSNQFYNSLTNESKKTK